MLICRPGSPLTIHAFDDIFIMLLLSLRLIYGINFRFDHLLHLYFNIFLECFASLSTLFDFLEDLYRFCFLDYFFPHLILLKGTPKVLSAADLRLISSN